MRIEYRILWIDNAPEWVESKVDEVEEYLLNFGFTLKSDIKPSYKGIDFSHYDIIAVDCHLDDDEEGVDALSLIRDSDVYTEILFYSQDGESVLREQMKTNRIDGVYCAGREDSIDKLKKLILTTIQKTQEINNLRGLVMAETSELDRIMKAILLKVEWAEAHFTDRHTKLDDHLNDQKKKLQKYLPFSTTKMTQFIHGHFASRFSLWSLEKFITKDEWLAIKEYEEIMEKRNFLAHGTELSNSPTGVTITKTKSDGSAESLTFTSNDFIELRKKIKEFKKKFETILNK